MPPDPRELRSPLLHDSPWLARQPELNKSLVAGRFLAQKSVGSPSSEPLSREFGNCSPILTWAERAYVRTRPGRRGRALVPAPHHRREHLRRQQARCRSPPSALGYVQINTAWMWGALLAASLAAWLHQGHDRHVAPSADPRPGPPGPPAHPAAAAWPRPARRGPRAAAGTACPVLTARPTGPRPETHRNREPGARPRPLAYPDEKPRPPKINIRSRDQLRALLADSGQSSRLDCGMPDGHAAGRIQPSVGNLGTYSAQPPTHGRPRPHTTVHSDSEAQPPLTRMCADQDCFRGSERSVEDSNREDASTPWRFSRTASQHA